MENSDAKLDGQKQNLLSKSEMNDLKSQKFYIWTRNIVFLLTAVASGTSAIFIMINTFMFSYEAFKLAQVHDIEYILLQNLVMCFYKFLMLIMFTISLLAGSLVPLGIMYIVFVPKKTGTIKITSR